jgi:hypothetical protein
MVDMYGGWHGPKIAFFNAFPSPSLHGNDWNKR